MFNDNWSAEQIERELALKFSTLINDQQDDQHFDQSFSSGGRGDLAGVLSKLSDALDNQSLFGSEIRSLRDQIESLKAERDQQARQQAEVVHGLRKEVEFLKQQLSKDKQGAGIDFPPSDFLASPLVIKSGGEYLGVQGKGKKHFSLEDFVQLIERKDSETVAVGTSWKRQNGHWVLVVHTEDREKGRTQDIVLVAKKTVTPSRNTVTEIIRLNIDGNDAPDALLLTLFKQVKTVFNG